MSPRQKSANSDQKRDRSPRGEAIAKSRREGTVIRQYLEALEGNKPKRGRKRTAETVQRQLEQVEEKLVRATALDRVELIQQRLDLTAELERMNSPQVDLQGLEDQFAEVARDYGQRKGISYAAWREAGVDAAVLKRAGITRSAS